MAKTRQPRYGIAEWYGAQMHRLPASVKAEYAAVACAPGQNRTMPCPFLSSLISSAKCNKEGGVCAIRRYKELPDSDRATYNDGQSVTLCPIRFLEDTRALRWVAEVVLGTSNPIVIKEVPFLEKLAASGEHDTEGNKAGRIDWILVHPNTEQFKWCALETQSVYFSGTEMRSDFEQYKEPADGLFFPAATRRPDYRSSGPKRLAPQLKTKVPELGAWGAKTAVIVDKYFYDNMSTLPQVNIRGGDKAAMLSAAEVIWFVVDYDEAGNLVPVEQLYTKLDASIAALNATRPIPLDAFKKNILSLISGDTKTANKVFRL